MNKLKISHKIEKFGIKIAKDGIYRSQMRDLSKRCK